jgi:hypothetical protein
MELVSHGYSWEDACLFADAPVPLDCILETVTREGRAAASALP